MNDDLLKRDRWIVLAAIALLTALAWMSLLGYVRSMPVAAGPILEEPGMDMTGAMMRARTVGDLAVLFPMWAIMMVAMMTPSLTPMIVSYARVARESAEEGQPLADTGWFTTGYLLTWAVFSVLAATAHGMLERAAWLNPAMEPVSGKVAGAILIAAGLYQFTPLKNKCLSRCHSALAFLQASGGFKTGVAPSIHLGIRQGLYCIGCCWALMALLFAGGVMNVFWIVAISTHLVIEKALAAGHVIARLSGAALAVAGIWLLFK